MRPLIGITPWYDHERSITFIKPGYVEGIEKSGGMPVILPLIINKNGLDEILDRFDGFLLSGGPDVDAKYYGEQNAPYNGEICPLRDQMETYIVKEAMRRFKPIFGICRGIQIMNVAMGGTLYQDIAAQSKIKAFLKHSQTAPKWYATHEVSLLIGSRTQKFFNNDNIRINSFHHQAINDVAKDFCVTGIAPDGIVEAIEHNSHPFAVGVQWHPELMWQRDEQHLIIFKEFVKSCQKK